MTPAPPLAELQRWMKRTLTAPQGARAAFDRERRRRFQAVIPTQGALGPGDRLAIYGDGYFARLTDCLGHNLPALKNVLGNTAFESLARNYLTKHPSTFRSVDEVGHRLPEFLATRGNLGPWKFLPDLARLEWACHRAFYADDAPPLRPADLQNRSAREWGRARLTFSPSARLLRLKWPLIALWRAEGRGPRRRWAAIRPRETDCLVFRNRDHQIRVWEIPKNLAAVFPALRRGRPLGSALQSAGGRGDPRKRAESFQEFFAGVTAEGGFSGIVFPTPGRAKKKSPRGLSPPGGWNEN